MNNALTAIKEMFSYPFRDPQWKMKFLVGSGISLAGFFVPILPWIVLLGYGARFARQVAGYVPSVKDQAPQPESVVHVKVDQAGELQLADQPGEESVDQVKLESDDTPQTAQPVQAASHAVILPEWDDWGGLMMDGLRQFGVSFFTSLPLLVVYMVGMGTYLAGTFGLVLMDNSNAEPFSVIFFIFGLGLFFLSMAVSIVLLPVTYLLLPAAATHVAVTQRFGAFFKLGEWLANLRAHLGEYLALLFCLAGLYGVLMLVFYTFYFLFFLCCYLILLVAPLTFLVTLLFYYMSGLAYRGSDVVAS